MKIRFCLAAILLFLYSTQVIFAQEQKQDEQKKVIICSDCFNLNRKPISLPKPEYSKAAIAVRASGDVGVQILISENGDVIEAKATSGHPLLWAASVKAALQAKFTPVTISGKKVRGYGFIVYKFNSDNLQINGTPKKRSENSTGNSFDR